MHPKPGDRIRNSAEQRRVAPRLTGGKSRLIIAWMVVCDCGSVLPVLCRFLPRDDDGTSSEHDPMEQPTYNDNTGAPFAATVDPVVAVQFFFFVPILLLQT